ncbi:hypothetical protein [Acetobacter persici]|uniref:Uncharacterized protein n=1 Tax=Acetobacter persici TaxID=1076596 RepID=A0A6V8I7D6_9PROT|nr:hypothetical protein [Acetobacter persici]OUI89925.1 hypothetical protein HK19_13440 [Acetobacter persici]GFE93528.1 hypothetical protein DmAi_15870 [Acetobacter persici]
MAKQKNDQAPAHSEDEISALFGKVTDGVSVKVSMGPEGRNVVRDFLVGLDENLTVADVKSALEADWS